MQYNIIPIVYGGADYKSILPDNSYIDVRSFKSAKSLADYLYKVGSDEKLYNSFFEWKKHFQSVVTHIEPFCTLCTSLKQKKI